MFEKMVEQAQTAVKPMSDMFALNTEVMEKLAEKQATFFSDLMNDGVNYAKDLAEQKDVAGFYDLQKGYFESLQTKFVSTAKDSYTLISEAQEKTGEVLKEAFSDCIPSMASMMPATTPAKPAKTTKSAKTTEKPTEK